MISEPNNIGKAWIKILSDAEVEKVHEQSLLVLEETGIDVNHEAGLKLLEEAGARVDHQTKRVKIPKVLVDQCLATLPEEITLGARNSEKDCIITPNCRPFSRNGGGSDFTLDLVTGKFRPLLKADMVEYYRLIDGLQHIDFVAPVYAQDLPVIGRDILVLQEILANTDKHVHMRIYSKESLEFVIEMAQIVAGGKESLKERPILSLLESPVSPLKFVDIIVDSLFLCGEAGIPVELCVMPISGGTGPMTLAGNTLLFNVEFLGCVVISQLANPGAPLEYAPRPMIMDMKTGIGLTGSIEAAMMSVAGAQMARLYHVPVSLHGPWTDSIVPDGQATFESTYFAFLPAFAGAHVLAGAGMLQQGLSISHIKLVIDDEIHGTILRFLEGYKVDEDHLGANAIGRVGPGGNFLLVEHTMKFLRSGERYEPNLLYRQARETWEAEGSKNFQERAKERALTIIKEHQPTPLPEDLSKALDELVSDALRLLNK